MPVLTTVGAGVTGGVTEGGVGVTGGATGGLTGVVAGGVTVGVAASGNHIP